MGLVVGFLLALFTIGAVTTFSQVSGRGTYAAGYMVLPRCPSDISAMEVGSMCSRGSETILSNGRGPVAVTTQAYTP